MNRRVIVNTVGGRLLATAIVAIGPELDPAPLLLALAAGTMSASYAIFLRLGAGSINPALGALIISGVALPFTAVVFAILRVWHPGAMITTRGLSLMILAGIAAASTTVFGLLAYARGFKLSSSPIITVRSRRRRPGDGLSCCLSWFRRLG
jgi:uncharacterized membrane protein